MRLNMKDGSHRVEVVVQVEVDMLLIVSHLTA